jgi:DNA-binding NarL/FixJ family response regulator
VANPSSSGTIMIVDHDPIERHSLAAVFRGAGYTTRELESGEELLEAAQQAVPALVVLEVCLPGVSGYQVCHDLRAQFGTGLPIVFVSAARTESYDRVAGLLIGGDDYLAKPVAADELLIRARRLLGRLPLIDPLVRSRLTKRELEILHLLADGSNTRDIASRLVISAKTVNTHVDRILAKVGVHSRAELVAAAYRRSLIDARAGSTALPEERLGAHVLTTPSASGPASRRVTM